MEEKRMVGDYEVIACQRIDGEEIIVGVNDKADPSEKYLCCYVERNELMELCTYGLASESYAEIIKIYGERITDSAKNAVERFEREKQDIGNEDFIITADKCTCITDDSSLVNKVIVISSEVLSPEYQNATHQLMLCTGGFGSYPNARGRTCFCTSLYDGHKTNFRRQDVLGIMEQDKLPEWAKNGYEKACKSAKKEERNER